MPRIVIVFGLLVLFGACATSHPEMVEARGPTIIGLYPSMTESRLEASVSAGLDLVQLLGVLDEARDCVFELVTLVRLVKGSSFRASIDGRSRTVEVPNNGLAAVAAVLLTPGREPRVVLAPAGPDSLADTLPAAAAEYFNVPGCEMTQ